MTYGTLHEEGLNRSVELAALAVLIAFPFVASLLGLSSFWIFIFVQIFVFAIAVMSYDLLFGYTGLLSFGHALFFGGGAYAVALMMLNLEMGYIVSIPVALLALGIVAVGVGALSLKVSGVYFAIITLAFAQIAYEGVLHFRGFTGGRDGLTGITMPTIAGIDFGETVYAYFITLLVMACVYVGLRRIVSSPFGRVIRSIRENEARTQMLGIDTYRYKLVSFVIAALVGCLAGTMYFLYIPFVTPELMFWVMTGDILIMGLIGGFGTLWGAILGAVFYVLVRELLGGVTDHSVLVMGAVFVLFVLFLPSGLAGLFDRSARDWRRNVPFLADREERVQNDEGQMND